MDGTRNRLWAAVLGVLALALGCNADIDEEVLGRLTREVRRSVIDTNRAPNEGVILAMRALHDERLRPLFAGMELSDEPVLKLHGIFGLADLSEERKVNIVQIAGISDHGLRALVLGQAMGGDYLTPRQMRQVLTWPELEPGLELLVNSKLVQAGEEVNVDRLREIGASCTDEQIPSEIFALLLTAQVEGDSSASEARARLNGLSESARAPMVAFALRLILSEKMSSLRDFVVELNAQSGSGQRARLQSLATLLSVDAALGQREWTSAYESEQELTARIRLALVLLESAQRVSPDAFDPMIAEELELLGAMGRAGRAVAAGKGEGPAMAALLAHEHAPTISWTLSEIEAMETARRVRVLREIFQEAMRREDPSAEVEAYMYAIARLLERAEPGATGEFLAEASERGDGAFCEVLLASLNSTEPHLAWDVDAEPSWPDRTTRVLAAIAEARAGVALSPEKVEILVSAGIGAETLPPAFRVQAAWLAMCQLGLEREALTKILAPASD